MEKCDPVYLLVLLLWVIAMLQARVSPKRIQDDFKLKIKLVDGESENEGFLIIRREHGWFYQCQHFWGLRNSKVACRELGFAKVVATQNARYKILEVRLFLGKSQRHMCDYDLYYNIYTIFTILYFLVQI